mmetsp:Transcript_21787/g.51456  ORF Transcript_21787/g.51456 Transcript_21787/m.51456 type:complete len:234 (-) Transcript_21787:633-1334(-)
MTHSSFCASVSDASSVSTASSKSSSPSLSSSPLVPSFSAAFFSLSPASSPVDAGVVFSSLDVLLSSFLDESPASTDSFFAEDCPTGLSLERCPPLWSSNNILDLELDKDDSESDRRVNELGLLPAVPPSAFCLSAIFSLRALAFSLRRLSSRAVPNMAIKPLSVLKNTSVGMIESSPKYVRRPVQASTASSSSADKTLSRTSAEMANWPIFVWARTELTSATKLLSPLPLAWR